MTTRKIYRKCYKCQKRIEIINKTASHSKIVCKVCVYKHLGIPTPTSIVTNN